MLTEEDSLPLVRICWPFSSPFPLPSVGGIWCNILDTYEVSALTALTSHIETLVWFSNLDRAYLLRVHSTLSQLPLLPSKRTLQKHLLLHCICFTSHLFSISSFVIIPNILPFLSKLLLIDWLVLHNTKGLLTLFKK